MPKTIDSNKTNLTYAAETSLKVLPGNPTWHPLQPNSYSSFGGDVKTVMREPITGSRQRYKGTVTDLDVKAGINVDMTQNNLTRLLQGFLFAHAHEKAKTAPISPSGTSKTVTAVAAGQFTASAAIGTVPTDSILLSKGFANLENNSLTRVTAVAGAVYSVSPYKGGDAEAALVAEAAPPAGASLEVVGIALSGDVELYVPGSTFNGGVTLQAILSSAADVDFTTLGLLPGEWVYLGDNDDDLGDTAATEYNFLGTGNVRNRGYCRIASIAAHEMTFDLAIGASGWAQGGGTGGACSIPANGFVSLYFGTVIRNEPAIANIIRTTYTLQRYLGQNDSDADQLEYISGAIPNELTLNAPSNNKVTADLSFVGMDTLQESEAALAGTYEAETNEPAINTAQDLYAAFLYIVDATKSASAKAPLFGFATDEKLVVNNNTKPNKALGVVGAIEGSVGNFDVSGTLTCYFDDIAALQAVRNNSDVGLSNIFAAKNSGFIFDLPLLTVSSPGAKVEKDKPIMVDISQNAAPGALDFTLLFNSFAYLPDAAMAS